MYCMYLVNHIRIILKFLNLKSLLCTSPYLGKVKGRAIRYVQIPSLLRAGNLMIFPFPKVRYVSSPNGRIFTEKSINLHLNRPVGVCLTLLQVIVCTYEHFNYNRMTCMLYIIYIYMNIIVNINADIYGCFRK